MCEKINKVMFSAVSLLLYKLSDLVFVYHPVACRSSGEQLAQHSVWRSAGATLRGQHEDGGHTVPAGAVQ